MFAPLHSRSATSGGTRICRCRYFAINWYSARAIARLSHTITGIAQDRYLRIAFDKKRRVKLSSITSLTVSHSIPTTAADGFAFAPLAVGLTPCISVSARATSCSLYVSLEVLCGSHKMMSTVSMSGDYATSERAGR